MKFLFSALILLICISTQAQIAGPRLMQNPTNTSTITAGDTINSTNTLLLATPSLSGGSKITIQVNAKKVTGTVSFKGYLEYSADGDASHTWQRVDSTIAPTWTGTDGDNVIVYPVDKVCKSYRMRIVNITGTSMIKSWFTYW